MKQNIIILGDSITYGANDTKKGGWATMLKLKLEKQFNYNLNVFVLGISGEISAELLARFEGEVAPRHNRQNFTPKFIFATGINDTQDVEGEDRVSIAEFEMNIKELIKKARTYTNDISFIGLTPVDEARVKNKLSKSINKYKSFFNEKVVAFDNIIQKICQENKLAYIKMFDLLSEHELSDGLHPTTKGHEKMFERIQKELNL